jgi:hypothetical protein
MTAEDHTTSWASILIMLLSLLIAIPLLLAILGQVGAVFPHPGGTPLERAVAWALFYLVLPLGVLDSIVAAIDLRRKRGNRLAKAVAISGIVLGLLGALTGLFLWLLISGALGQVY